MAEWSSIVLTGASGGLGRALALELAAPGRRLLLCGRDAARLDELAQQVAARGAEPAILTLPLTDLPALAEALQDHAARHPVDLLIANAGVKTGNRDGIEPADHMARVIAVNLTGAIGCTQAVLPGMLARGRGHVVLVSSLAAVSPHAGLLSYTASKAGLLGYAGALRRAVAGRGVAVTAVIPGFIDTPMSDRHLGPKPLMMSPEAAARRIARGLSRRPATIALPRRLVWLARLGALLPPALSDWTARGFHAETLPDRDERHKP